MELEFILEKLKEQQKWLSYANLDIWLPTTYQYVEDYFKNYSTRASNFKDLIREYEAKKVTPKTSILGVHQFDEIKNKARAFLTEIISVIEHDQQQLEKAREINLANEKKRQQLLATSAIVPKAQTKQAIEQKPVVIPEPKVIFKTRLPFGMNPELFWAIIVVIVGLAYWLGLKLETYELHDQVKQLKADTTAMGIKIKSYDAK